ncbi:putative lipoprotein [Escherichia coli DEC10D]|nr:putative lipoprotein [Escherichia coli DEC10D]
MRKSLMLLLASTLIISGCATKNNSFQLVEANQTAQLG